MSLIKMIEYAVSEMNTKYLSVEEFNSRLIEYIFREFDNVSIYPSINEDDEIGYHLKFRLDIKDISNTTELFIHDSGYLLRLSACCRLQSKFTLTTSQRFLHKTGTEGCVALIEKGVLYYDKEAGEGLLTELKDKLTSEKLTLLYTNKISLLEWEEN